MLIIYFQQQGILHVSALLDESKKKTKCEDGVCFHQQRRRRKTQKEWRFVK
jgi:hypothetical protein